MIPDERKFIHDLTGPLGAAMFLADSLIDSMQKMNANTEEIKLLNKLVEALELAKTLIEKRRSYLIQKGESGG